MEPIRARKVAWALTNADRSVGYFAGLSVPVPYKAEDEAVCHPTKCSGDDGTPVPHLQGTCGFHIEADEPLGWMMPELALLDVELYGRVIRHEHGYRGARQRVLGVTFVRGCPDCQRAAGDTLLVTVPALVADDTWMVRPRCRSCSQRLEFPWDGEPIGLAEAASLLGTEVAWADEETTNAVMRVEAARNRDRPPQPLGR